MNLHLPTFWRKPKASGAIDWHKPDNRLCVVVGCGRLRQRSFTKLTVLERPKVIETTSAFCERHIGTGLP